MVDYDDLDNNYWVKYYNITNVKSLVCNKSRPEDIYALSKICSHVYLDECFHEDYHEPEDYGIQLFASIWIILIIPRIVFFLLLSLKMSDEFSSFAHAILHVFYTIPTIGIIFMYCVLQWCVRKSKKKNQDEMFQSTVSSLMCVY